MWRTAVEQLGFMPEDGKKYVAAGRLAVYEPRGQYQIIVKTLEPLGIGALAAAFEQLKKKLAAEGLFRRSPQTAAATISALHRHSYQPDRRRCCATCSK